MKLQTPKPAAKHMKDHRSKVDPTPDQKTFKMNAVQWVSVLAILKLIVKQDSIKVFNLKWILIPHLIFITTGVVMDEMNLHCESHK